MLSLVEGLNCSGKTTYIKNICGLNTNCKPLQTPHINPIRFSPYKKWLLVDSVCKIVRRGLKLRLLSNYQVGAYESLFYYFKNSGVLEKVSTFWDRTWISSYVYGTLDYNKFVYLADIYKDRQVDVIYFDVPVDICLERFQKRNEKRDYVAHNSDPKRMKEFWEDVSDKFAEAIEILQKLGYNIKILTNTIERQ